MELPHESIADAEKAAFQILNRELDQHLLLSQSASKLIGMMISAMPDRSIQEVPAAEKVAVALIIRLCNDLRSVSLLAMPGYPTQAASLTASMYETAYTVAYIASNNNLANKWICHDDPTRPFENIKRMTREGLANLDAPDPDRQAKIEYRVYSQLCMVKHANPLYQMQHGHQLINGSVVASNGPDTSEPAIRAAWYALEYSVRFVCVAVHSFILNHVSVEARDPLVQELNNVIQGVKQLNERAKQRWGTKDPFPGKWRV